MKKNFIAKMSILLACIMLICVSLTGCFGSGGDNSDPTPKEYTIQYSDDAGIHTLTVTEGKLYSLESVPYKFGYEFLGLYDAQTGGTQYVGADGGSLSPYNDKADKVLYPQFKPIDYTVILDYGNATVTGERSLTVAYNATLPELPKNLTLEHNEFTGWYTEAGGKGTQVADAYGNLPVVSVLNEENFKLDDSKRVYLYAGFELEKYTVTFIFDNDMPSEEVEVPYNTPISQVVSKTRNDKKEAGLTWSKSKTGEVFNGNVTDDIVLYVQEWAPVIELNGNGADVTPIVARAGSTISLPTPTKPLAKFLRWEDENGQEKDISTMPTESMTLNAVWQAKIEFDENGGTDVDDISKPAGESISLPTPTKEGYLFAGWYTAQKEQYARKTMPSAGIALKAGWYEIKTETIVKIPSTNVIFMNLTKPSTDNCYNGLSTEQLLDVWANGLEFKFGPNYGVYGATITIEWHFKAQRIDNSSNLIKDKMHFEFYSEKRISSSTLLSSHIIDIDNSAYKDYNFTSTHTISDSLYMFWFCNEPASGYSNNACIKDFYYTIHYPNTSNLYL